jgi:hypothetical protein
MSTRTTQTELESLARTLNETLGRPTRPTHVENGSVTFAEGCLVLGGWEGGWNLDELHADSSQSHVLFGQTKRDIADKMRAMLTGIDYARRV